MEGRNKKNSRTVTNRVSKKPKPSEKHLSRPLKKIAAKRSNRSAAEKTREYVNAPLSLVAVLEIVKAEMSMAPVLDEKELEHFGT